MIGKGFVTGFLFEKQVKRVKDFFEGKENIATKVGISDWVLNADGIVVRGVANQLNYPKQFFLYDGEIFLDEDIKED